jgi:hypothetical protein
MESGAPRPREPEPAESVGAASEPEPEPARSLRTTEQALRLLQHRLDAASTAAERLITDAARVASVARPAPPPAGWRAPDGNVASRSGPDVEALVHFVQSLRDLIPADLQRRLAEAVREVLLAIRALIDWYLERFEPSRNQTPEVQDIPIL